LSRRAQQDRATWLRRLLLYRVVAVLALALFLGSGSAASTPGALSAPYCKQGTNGLCLSITILPSGAANPGTVTVESCVQALLATPAAASAGCPPNTMPQYGYPTTCPSDPNCGNLGVTPGATVILTADPSLGWVFDSWSGIACTGNPCSFSMSTKTDVTARFVRQQELLTVTVNPSGAGTVTDNLGKLSCTSSCMVNYDYGSSVTLNAKENPGYRFTGWSGACTGTGSCVVPMNQARSVTANFIRVFTLAIAVSGNGGVSYTPVGDSSGTCTSSCVVHYDAGTAVTLTAVGGSDPFATWGGDCASNGTQPNCNLTMDTDKSVTATFSALATPPPPPPLRSFRLTVDITGSGKVTTSGLACSQTQCHADYPEGIRLTLAGAPSSPNVNFNKWDGACVHFSPAENCTLVMDGNKNVTAAFSTRPVVIDLPPCTPDLLAQKVPCEPNDPQPVTKSLVVNVSGADGGHVKGTVNSGALTAASTKTTPPPINCGANEYACYGDYTQDQTMTLTAKPAQGFRFSGWLGACNGRKSCTLSLSEARNVTATFTPKGKRALRISMDAKLSNPRWVRSDGSAILVVTGTVARSATLTLDVRKRRGGSLLHRSKHFQAGSYRFTESLPRSFLSKGANLLPGGKVVSIGGEAGRARVPLLVRTVGLRGPARGIVRRSFMTGGAERGGREVGALPSSAKIAWANFVFAQQPVKTLDLWVSWSFPGGHHLGDVRKANRLKVSSFIRSGQPLPRGCWVAWLRAGPNGEEFIKRQFVRIGVSKNAKCS
jgi:hypothetical protein